jgi:hypothetical protein
VPLFFSEAAIGNNMSKEDGEEGDSALSTDIDIGKAGDMDSSCCASCGIVSLKLMTSTKWRHVMPIVSLLDIAAAHVSGIIDRFMEQCARREWLNCVIVMTSSLSSPKAATLETVQSAFCLWLLMQVNV